jgi:hypothetical protein
MMIGGWAQRRAALPQEKPSCGLDKLQRGLTLLLLRDGISRIPTEETIVTQESRRRGTARC